MGTVTVAFTLNCPSLARLAWTTVYACEAMAARDLCLAELKCQLPDAVEPLNIWTYRRLTHNSRSAHGFYLPLTRVSLDELMLGLKLQSDH